MIRYDKPLYCHDDRFCCSAGEHVIDKMILDYPSTGGVALKKVGEIPIYEQIQAARVDCDLESVLQSCVHTNQASVLDMDSLNDLVVDFTTVTNLGELYSSTKRIENTFYDLPIEVREQFNSDIKQFIREIGSDDFDRKVTSGFDAFNGSYHQHLNELNPSTSNGSVEPVVPVEPVGSVEPVVPDVN